MNSQMSATWTILAAVLMLVTQYASGQCQVQYTEQPPQELSCQPYDTLLDPAFVHVTFACAASSTEPRNFSLHWMRELPNGYRQDLGCPVHHINTATQQRCLLRLAGTEPPAQYWCEVWYATDNGIAPAQSSAFSLGPFTEYSGEQCITTQSQQMITCADPPTREATTTTSSGETITLPISTSTISYATQTSSSLIAPSLVTTFSSSAPSTTDSPSGKSQEFTLLERILLALVCSLSVLVALLVLALVGAIYNYRRRLRRVEGNQGIAMATRDSLEHSTSKYVQPLSCYTHRQDSHRNLLTRGSPSQYQSLQSHNMNYTSIYSIPTESVTSRQVTPTNSLTGERIYANDDEFGSTELQSATSMTVLAEVHHHQVIPYASLDLHQRENPQLYTAPQNNPREQ